MSCRKDKGLSTDFELEISTDSLLFDTVFTTVGSITKRVKVFNTSNQDIEVAEIFLGGRKATGNSNYRLNINGKPSNAETNVFIPAKDSIYIFAEVTIDPNGNDLPFIVTDSIVFDLGNGKEQKVQLAAYGQNAIFFNADSIPCNFTFTAAKPYVIYNSAVVLQGCTLRIEAGAKLYFNSNSTLFIAGTLIIEGTKDEPVTFRGDRLDPFYKDLPGTWGGIHLLRGSTNNRINHADIQNGTIGIRIDSLPELGNFNLLVRNTEIRNMVFFGILGFSAKVDGENLIISECGRQIVAGDLGGTYNFRHCTFSNENFSFNRTTASFLFTNADYTSPNGTLFINNLDASFRNCILTGVRDEELELNSDGQGTLNLFVSHSLVKTKLTGLDINNNIINQNPKFKDSRNNDYAIDTLSVVYQAGENLIPTFPTLATDFEGKVRSNLPTLGALERIE